MLAYLLIRPFLTEQAERTAVASGGAGGEVPETVGEEGAMLLLEEIRRGRTDVVAKGFETRSELCSSIDRVCFILSL